MDIRAAVLPIASDIRNAYIDFSKMTVSVVALETDVIRKPVIGYGFNSNGRDAASGLLREPLPATSAPGQAAGHRERSAALPTASPWRGGRVRLPDVPGIIDAMRRATSS